MIDPEWEFSPEWQTDTAITLARHIWLEKDFGVMPILADALQDAGCDQEDLLTRLRDPDCLWCRGSRILSELRPR